MINDTDTKLNAKINIQELTIVDEDFIDITEIYTTENVISNNTERIIKLETDINLLKDTEQTKSDSNAIDNIISRLEQLENKFNSLETSASGEYY